MSPPPDVRAEDSSALHAYVAWTQMAGGPTSIFWKSRVSTRAPLRLNSFQTFVPTGNVHSLGLLVSICAPLGSRIQRCFSAPSDQRGTAG